MNIILTATKSVAYKIGLNFYEIKKGAEVVLVTGYFGYQDRDLKYFEVPNEKGQILPLQCLSIRRLADAQEEAWRRVRLPQGVTVDAAPLKGFRVSDDLGILPEVELDEGEETNLPGFSFTIRVERLNG